MMRLYQIAADGSEKQDRMLEILEEPLSMQFVQDQKLNLLLEKLGHKFSGEFGSESGYANKYDFHRIATHYAYENTYEPPKQETVDNTKTEEDLPF